MTDDPNGLGFDLPEAKRLSTKRALAIAAGLVVLIGGAGLAGLLPKLTAKAALAENLQALESSAPRVEVVTPKTGTNSRPLKLPGSVRPREETVVYPRANGYVRAWKVDIGDKVAEGDLLAEIDTPELDQELEEARAELEKSKASLAQAEVSLNYAGVNLRRSEGLVAEGIAPAQELDDRRAQSQLGEANVNVSKAAVSASQAKLRQLGQLKSYARITAPFAGTVSSRSVERGSLVSPSTPLFKIAATDTLRVFVSVPQNLAPYVVKDTKAKVRIREFPGRTFDAVVARTSGTLDPASRTLNTEVHVPNDKNELLAGMYAEVELDVGTTRRSIEIPPTALMNDAAGLRVAVVDGDDTIRFRPITIERDAGSSIVVASGLDGSERVVRVASASLRDGQKVAPAR
ncbi:MAG TPA: efflux RND transporter periplasmic adaptor subunit [Polyangiaceae bacterium]